MQIRFSARALVGRGPLITAVAAGGDILERTKRGAHSRTALTGQSWVGKTVLAREVCNRLLEALPLQVMLLGTSSGTLRMELARLGRAFTPSLAEEAGEEQAVEAARRFLASTTRDTCCSLMMQWTRTWTSSGRSAAAQRSGRAPGGPRALHHAAAVRVGAGGAADRGARGGHPVHRRVHGYDGE